MLKLLKLFAWSLLVLVLLIGFDQFMIRVPLQVPGVTQAQTFYVDFRGRLLGLIGVDSFTGRSGQSIEQVIEANSQPPAVKVKPAQRYLYVDDSGILQFADSLDQVPARYRDAAQPLAE